MSKKKIFVGIIVLAAIIGIVYVVQANQSTGVDMFTLKKGDIQSFIELRGKVDLEKKQKVYTKVAGTVEQIAVNEGESVDKNTKLLSLDTEDLDMALKKSQAAFDAAKSSTQQIINSIKPEQIQEAKAQLDQAIAAFNAAKKDNEYKEDKLNKTRELFKSGAISEQDLKDAEQLAISSESSIKDIEQKVKIAQYDLDILLKGASKEAIDTAEANARQSAIEVDNSKKGLDRANIFSPSKGTILRKYVSEGDMLQPGTPVFEVGDSNSVYISVSVLSDDVVKIKEGQKAIISGDALNDKKIDGEVYFIAPKAENSVSALGVEQQRVEVRIKFDSSSIKLKPGFGVDVSIITSERNAALYVPYKAVFQINGKDNVFIVDQNKLKIKVVKKGIENNDYIEIVEGLSDGDVVVVDPDSALKPGERVSKL